MAILKAAILLFLVIDPMGNVPLFVSFLSGIPPRRARWIAVRELLIALAVLVFFLVVGDVLLNLLQVGEPALGIAGGIILFLIAIKMIFASAKEIFPHNLDGEPFVVPLAIPFVAGPSAMATVLLLRAGAPSQWLELLVALVAAWLVSGAILVAASPLSRFLGARGLNAMERLMGLLLTTVAVQMFLTGVKEFFAVAPR
ncbi:MAG: NAAT family transporter [Pirellulales bacterium]|nr:NAAT family transporter [Pirellulales bacterium]